MLHGNICAHECDSSDKLKIKNNTHKTTNYPNLLISLSIEMHPEHISANLPVGIRSRGMQSIAGNPTPFQLKEWSSIHLKSHYSNLTNFYTKCAILPSRAQTKNFKVQKEHLSSCIRGSRLSAQEEIASPDDLFFKPP